MLVFVIPLKSKKNAKDWKLTCKLLERTLRSICRQTDPNFRVIVVCHEKSDVQFNHPRIQYLEVKFPVPSKAQEKEYDKGRKIISGLMYARQLSPDYVMIADADDCFSCNLADFVNQNPKFIKGWLLTKGYVYEEGSPFIYYYKNSYFHTWCGSCNIIRYDLLPIPEKCEPEDFSDELIFYYSGHNHAKVSEQMASEGNPFQELPFAGVIYMIGHGDNLFQRGGISGLNIYNPWRGTVFFLLKESLKYRLVTSSIRQEFNLYNI